MEERTCSIIKVTCLLCFVITVALTERLYNKSLFQYSLDYIINLQNSTPGFFITFLNVVSYSCNFEVIFPIIIIIFNFCSLKITFLLFNVLFLSLFVTGIMKLVFLDARPFWINANITFFKSEVDYGNPSGHSMFAFSFYLILFQIIYDKYVNDKDLLYKISYWISVISFLFLIAFSRLAGGVHSINQVLFGSLVGVTIFFAFYFILGIQNYNSEEFLAKFQQGNYYTLWYILKYLAGVVKSVIVFYIHKFDNTKWEANLKKICPNWSNISDLMKFQNFDLGLTILIFSCIGMISGIFIMMEIMNLRSPNSDLVRLEAMNNWTDTKFSYKIYRVILSLIFCVIIILPIYLITLQIPYVMLRISLTFGLMIFILFFSMFTLLIYIFIKLGITNENLTFEKDHNNIIEEANHLILKENETSKENFNIINEDKNEKQKLIPNT